MIASSTDKTAMPISALVLDDSAFDRRRISRMGAALELPITFEEAATLDAMRSCLSRGTYDVMLIDYHLSEGDGLAALEVLKQDERNRDSIKIMVSNDDRLNVAVNALKMGCDDYLNKSAITAEALRHAILQARERRAAAMFSMQQHMLRTMLLETLSDTFRSESFRQSMLPILVTGLEEASRSLAVARRLEASPGLRGYLQSFREDEEFEFARRPSHQTN